MTQVHQFWKGLQTAASPTAIDAGWSVEQVNIHARKTGVLEPRLGITPLTTATLTSQKIYTSMFFAHPVYNRILSHGTTYLGPHYNGDIYAYNMTTRAYASITQAGITCTNGFSPVNFFRDRRNVAFGVNGLGRGFRWNGISASAAWMGIDAPTAAPTISGAGTSGGTNIGEYICAYRFMDADGNPSSISPLTTFSSATALLTLTWSTANTLATDNRANNSAAWKELYRSTADQSRVLYLAGTVSPTTTGYTDTRTDAYLTTAQTLPVYNVNGTPHAYRFTPPPYHKPFACMFKDRAFYYGGVKYDRGTIGVSTSSATVTSGAAIFTGMDLSCGQGAGEFLLYVPGNTKAQTISSNNSTSLTLATTYVGTSTTGASFTINVNPVERRLLYYSEPDEPESVPVTNAIAVQENTGDYDEETGLMQLGSYLYLLHERHAYPATFVQQPDIDMSISPPIPRGCINNRCWVIAEGSTYLIDQLGFYRIGQGGEVEDIGTPIQDKFQDSTFDWQYSKWWSASFEPTERVVRWYVRYTSDDIYDDPVFPRRAICYDIDGKDIWEETFQFPISAPALISTNGRTRLTVGADVYGGSSTVGVTCLVGDGESEWTRTAARGTTTSGSTSSIVDATNTPFVAGMVGAPVSIIAGKGAGQTSRIWSVPTSGSASIFPAFSTSTDTTSVYLVGAIPWSIKTGSDPFTKDDNMSERKISVSFVPTSQASELNVQVYHDFASTATPWGYTYDTTEGITYSAGSTLAVCDMKLGRSSLSDQVGWVQLPFPTPANSQLPINRYMSVRLSGYKALEGQDINTILIEGVR